MGLRVLIAAVALAVAGQAAMGCDYPGPPPGSGEATASSGDILWAGFSDATNRYDHGILGDAIEAGGLRVRTATKGDCDLALLLPDTRVFEDIAPRIADLDGDGRNEVVVVETDIARGAMLAIYGLRNGKLKRLAATPPIGRTHRWLAPAGIGDLDGDGLPEIAYVDRPHLAKVLRVWRYKRGQLTEVAQLAGLTNHRIGDAHISGGFEICDGVASLLTVDAGWQNVMQTTLAANLLSTRAIARYRGRDSLICPKN